MAACADLPITVGYRGGYDAVRRYAAGWRRDRSTARAATFVPLSFAPGEAYQFDWSHEIVVLAGVTTTVKVAHLRLCHSRMFFVRAYPRESQETVFDAHDQAFAFFGGACQRGIYDSMKTAVEAIFVGRERRYDRRFEQMCGHYLVEPVTCTPATGWEKGQVENQVGLVRERLFTPRLRFKSYAELNAWLAERCVAHAQRAAHPELKERTVWVFGTGTGWPHVIVAAGIAGLALSARPRSSARLATSFPASGRWRPRGRRGRGPSRHRAKSSKVIAAEKRRSWGFFGSWAEG